MKKIVFILIITLVSSSLSLFGFVPKAKAALPTYNPNWSQCNNAPDLGPGSDRPITASLKGEATRKNDTEFQVKLTFLIEGKKTWKDSDGKTYNISWYSRELKIKGTPTGNIPWVLGQNETSITRTIKLNPKDSAVFIGEAAFCFEFQKTISIPGEPFDTTYPVKYQFTDTTNRIKITAPEDTNEPPIVGETGETAPTPGTPGAMEPGEGTSGDECDIGRWEWIKAPGTSLIKQMLCYIMKWILEMLSGIFQMALNLMISASGITGSGGTSAP